MLYIFHIFIYCLLLLNWLQPYSLVVRWYRRSPDGREVALSDAPYGSDSLSVGAGGAVLAISAARESHADLYNCVANNSMGTARMQVTTSPY